MSDAYKQLLYIVRFVEFHS